MPRSRRELGRDFTRRIYGPRALGCALSALFIGTVAYQGGHTPVWVWALMALNAFCWPTLAYRLGRASADPYAAEKRNLLLDGLFAGFWVGQMALNLLPSALLLAMVAMNGVAAGGASMLRATLGLQAVGVMLGLAAAGLRIAPETTQLQMISCVPMLGVYPVTVGSASYRLAVQLAEHKKAFKLISTLDGMTHLPHQAAWMTRLGETFEQCRAGEQGAILALLDIDDFKSVNDSHGHLVGDAMIGRLANLLRAGLGPKAVPGRYGGDEFCVILLGVTVSQACEQLNDIRKRFAEWTDGVSPAQASLSIGLVPYSRRYASERDWLHAADQALYRAKHSGKNRVWLQELPLA
ncbi:diguanylate cyclase [Pseudomonas massiliensis]|uniref:diguanylate cyclase n=1 Tax=Pseudomonas massiliensis TaxID=522492 RepID=UPI00058BC45E|nr:diguanylate cyclase [Pseudomonas massiliensis]